MYPLNDPTLHALGLQSFRSGWQSVTLLTVFAALLMVVASAWTGHVRDVAEDLQRHPRKLAFWITLGALYPVWALVQQGVVFAALHALRLSLPPEALPWAPAITALFFAAMHLPNYHLMFTVGLMVTLFIQHMDLHHNLAAVAVAHGLLATLWRMLSPPVVNTTLTVWGWYAAAQRELRNDMRGINTAGKRWARPPAFRWFRQMTGGE